MVIPKDAEDAVYQYLNSSGYIPGGDIYYRIKSVVAREIPEEDAGDLYGDYEDYEVTEDRDVDRES